MKSFINAIAINLSITESIQLEQELERLFQYARDSARYNSQDFEQCLSLRSFLKQSNQYVKPGLKGRA